MDEVEAIEKWGNSNWWHKFKTEKMLELCEGTNSLDLASGPGLLGSKLVANGYKVTFLDLSERAVKILTKKYKLNKNVRILKKNAEELGFENEFDCCLCGDGLEHMPNDRKVIKSVFSALKDGGVFVVNVPAVKSAFNEHDKGLGHLRRYKKRELELMLTDAGFEIEFSKYWNAFSLISKYISKTLGASETNTFWKITESPLNKILYSMVRLEWALPIPIGSSIMIKARKPLTD